MAKQFDRIDDHHRAFIARQKIFFTASAAEGCRVNISPRETGCLRILGDHAVAYRDLTGSGSETAAHMLADGRLTIMFCAFDGPPSILRLYGTGRVVYPGSAEFDEILAGAFAGEAPLGTRQIVVLAVDLVQTSCGYGVPLFAYEGERASIRNWAEGKGEAGLAAYRRDNNRFSMDGLPTELPETSMT